jgi:endonuclease IV
MSEEHFEATVEAAKDTAGEVTTAFMLREAKKTAPQKHIAKPKKGKKAEAQRKELKALLDKRESTLCMHARLLIGIINESDSFTQDELHILSEVLSVINKVKVAV